jgi:hypothetical protein
LTEEITISQALICYQQENSPFHVVIRMPILASVFPPLHN